MGGNDMTTTALSKDRPAADYGRPTPATGPAAGPAPGPAPGPEAGVIPLAAMAANAHAASRFLKALSNHNRLLLLCLLSEGEKTVGELETALGLRQPAISQQLARLRAEGLIAGRRDGKSIHYRLASEPARQVMLLLYELFCDPAQGTAAQDTAAQDPAAGPLEIAAAE